MSATRPLLDVKGLRVEFPGAPKRAPIIDGLNLSIDAGEAVALVGESGSGKSMTALSLMQLLPVGAAITGGSVRFDGEELRGRPSAALDRLRGNRLAMLFQQPHAMLDPTSRVGTQVAEPMRLHRRMDKHAALARAVELLKDLGIADAQARVRSFSYELSGGMAQRVMMAAALSSDPALLIADEPTTSLDVTVQAQILRLLESERRKRGLAVLLITHDLSIVAAFAERVAVMYAGRIIEEGPTAAVLREPRHPYTKGLIQCSLLQADRNGALFSIPGANTHAYAIRRGCRFLPRCEVAHKEGISDRCREMEPELQCCGPDRNARRWAVPSVGASPAMPTPIPDHCCSPDSRS